MSNFACIIIGASTGGPKALRVILQDLPSNLSVPIYLVQKIPPGLFSESLADGLNEVTELNVHVFDNKKIPQSGEAVLIPGGYNMIRDGGNLKMIEVEAVYNNTPHLDTTFREIHNFYDRPILCVLLTGMFIDDDPLRVLYAIKENGGKIIVQDPNTCFIPNMPKYLIDNDCYDKVSPLQELAKDILQYLK